MKVGIDNHHRVAPGMENSGADGGLMAEIASEGKSTPARIDLGLAAHKFPGPVPGTIIHADHFETQAPAFRRLG